MRFFWDSKLRVSITLNYIYQMDIEFIRETCLGLPLVTEDIKWEKNLCFMVYDKIFLMVSLDEVPTRANVKVPKDDFLEISVQDNFKQAAYLARGQWVTAEDISLLSRDEWAHYIQQSFDLIKSKLSKKLQATL
jgi:predicted DNA-binding protein (MmcQ/YjbR family)